MEIGLVSALTGPQLGSFQLAVAAQLAQMAAENNSNSIAQLNAAAQENFAPAPSAATNVGANLDVIA